MPTADEKPVLDSSTEPANRAESTPICQDQDQVVCLPSERSVTILYRRSLGPDPDFEAVSKQTGKEIQWFGTIPELEHEMRRIAGGVLTVIFATESERPTVIGHLREVERFVNSQEYCAVRTLVLLLDFAPPSLVAEFRGFGAEAMSLKPVHSTEQEFVNLLTWELGDSYRVWPTINISYSRSTEAVVTLVGKRAEVYLPYSGRLLDVLQALDHKWRRKKYIAKRADIPLSQTNMYIKRLRGIYNANRREAGVNVVGKNVFQAKKIGGIWLYRLAARLR
ncbi:MAG TPA: hypothetical protein VFR24_17280 [Candidatus Angelobacter sp.]|nr:hypothetical protein [Candidatus Angelobacter sp.]